MLHFPGATFLKLKCSQSRLQLLSKQRYQDVGLTASDSVGLLWNLIIVLSNKFSANCCWWWSWATLWKRLTCKKKKNIYIYVIWWEGSLKGFLPRLQWPHCWSPWKSYIVLTSPSARHLGTSSWRKMQIVSWQGTVSSLGSGSKTFILTHVVETVPGYFPRKTVQHLSVPHS